MTTMVKIKLTSAPIALSVNCASTAQLSTFNEHMTPTNMRARNFADPGVIFRKARAFVATWVPVVAVFV